MTVDKKGWLEKVLDDASADVKSWPSWLRDDCSSDDGQGSTEPSSASSSSGGPEEKAHRFD